MPLSPLSFYPLVAYARGEPSSRGGNETRRRSGSAKGRRLRATLPAAGTDANGSWRLRGTLATTGRVLTDMAAASASSSQLSQTKKAASLAGYTDRGVAVSVLTRLP
ncbi:MAG TPA: hypothetical protein VEK07_07285 [Polyangiaceae bacterium]|nr:hypothetical protein [Polyangiaceae bacterium]